MYRPKGMSKVFEVDSTAPPLILEKTGLPYQGKYYHYDPVDKSYYAGLPDQALEERVLLSTAGPTEIGKEVDSIFVPKNEYDRLRKDDTGYRIRATLAVPSYDSIPNEQDYNLGLYRRYFVQHKSSGEVYEIASEVYQELASESDTYHYPSYYVAECVWFLRGPVADQDINGYIVMGAAKKNDYVIELLEKSLPNIRTYLTDPSQFVK